MQGFHIPAAPPLYTNTFLLISDAGHAVVIDPAAEVHSYDEILKQHNATLTTILCTHGHYDHVGSAAALKAEWNAILYCEKADLAGDRMYPLSAADYGYTEGEQIAVDELRFTAWHTPGHTPGSVVLLCGESLAQESKNAFVTYGISEQIFDDVSRSEIRESIFCRKCGKKLEYQFFHYGQLGLYHCPNCGWNRPNPEYTAEHVVREDELYSFDMDGIHFDPQIRTPYNIYNTLSAYAALKTMGAGYEHFKEMIEAFDYGNNRESIFNINGARVQLHLAKNPIGFQQKVSHVLRDPNPKDIIIQINDTYQDGEDVSWLWDVDFQYLAESNARKIITAGTRKYDMALRLKYEDVSCESTDDMRASVLECVEQEKSLCYRELLRIVSDEPYAD